MKIKQSRLDSSVQCTYEHSVSQIDSTCFKWRNTQRSLDSNYLIYFTVISQERDYLHFHFNAFNVVNARTISYTHKLNARAVFLERPRKCNLSYVQFFPHNLHLWSECVHAVSQFAFPHIVKLTKSRRSCISSYRHCGRFRFSAGDHAKN